MQNEIDKKMEQTFSLKKSERELATLHTSLAELKTQFASYGQSCEWYCNRMDWHILQIPL